MKVNGIPSEKLKGKEVDTFQIYEREDEIYKAFHSFRSQQNKINGELINYVKHHEKIIEQMSEELEDMGHTAKQLDRHACMISAQCEQIAKTQSLILEQECPTNSVSTNVVLRSNKVTQGPKGIDWYEEEQARKKRDEEEAERRDRDLIDPRDIEKLNEERRGEQPLEEGNQKAQYPFESDDDNEGKVEQDRNAD